MDTLEELVPQLSQERDEACDVWSDACGRLLSAIDPGLRKRAADRIANMNGGGSGLRNWVMAIAWRGSPVPEQIPDKLVEIYLVDGDALPQHECEQCGVAIPVRVRRYHQDHDGQQIYFDRCPICGGRTGWYLHLSRQIDELERQCTDELRREKPR